MNIYKILREYEQIKGTFIAWTRIYIKDRVNMNKYKVLREYEQTYVRLAWL